MKNHTDCVVVIRAFYFEVSPDQFEQIRVKEFIFKTDHMTRRYCMVLDKKNTHIYEITEHSLGFFDKVVKASNGWALFNLYQSEQLDPVPINETLSYVANSKKYQYLQEFYVIFNSTCSEKSMQIMLEKAKKYPADVYSDL